MQRERAVDVHSVVEHAFVDHEPRAVVAFLARLEHEPDGTGQLFAPVVEQPCCADEHRRVRVVPAGVHATVDLAREVEAGVFRHRQRVHVAAQQHDRAVADAQVGDDRRNGVAGSGLEHEPVERVEHRGLRVGQLEPELGPTVHAAAEVDHVGQQAIGVGEELGRAERGHGGETTQRSRNQALAARPNANSYSR